MDETELRLINEHNSEMSLITAELSHEVGAAKFSAWTILARSLSIFIKHPFVFMGLSILSQVPGLCVLVFMRNSNRAIIAVVINAVFVMAVQGIIACGVLEVLRGNDVRFGKTLSRGMPRVISLILTALLCFFFFALAFFGIAFLIEMPQRLWLLLLALFAMLCMFSVFVPVCAVERLGPIESLVRSLNLTKGCLLKIAGLYLPCLVVIWAVHTQLTIIAKASVEFFFLILGSKSAVFFPAVIRMLIVAIPVTFTSIMTSVIYYSLREVKEGVGIAQLNDVFN
jgi:hypothetical protein